MTDAEKLALFDWVSLRGDRRLNFGVIGGRVVLAFGGARPHGAHVIERLDAAFGQAEGLSRDGHTLYVGALGIVSIVGHLQTLPVYANSGRAMHTRLQDLFSGSAHFPEMLRATIRAVLGQADAGGDTGVFVAVALRQLQSLEGDGVSVEVEPLPLSVDRATVPTRH